MHVDAWLPKGTTPTADVRLQRCLVGTDTWQIYESIAKGRVLVVDAALAKRWVDSGLVPTGLATEFAFGRRSLTLIEGGRGYRLEPVDEAEPPGDWSECQAFVSGLAASRAIEPDASFGDAIYVERLSRLLPCYSLGPRIDDSVVVGYWLTGGVSVALSSQRRLRALAPWITSGQLASLLRALEPASVDRSHPGGASQEMAAPPLEADAHETAPAAPRAEVPPSSGGLPKDPFLLPGRPALENFFNEHVIDFVRNEDRYKALGIAFPGAILLHGPPGCGKTFAIEKLVEYLDWPSFSIDSGSIGSPYIHETGRKIAEVFEQAAASSPSIVVLDEIDAFLAAREGGASGQHRVEEVAEFLRAIPKAAEHAVLVIGMTNRLDSLDQAAVRRGRFDHIIEIGMPSEQEVLSLLTSRFRDIPVQADLDLKAAAKALAGRPLSDIAFVVRESCRLTARESLSQVGSKQLREAMESTPSRTAAPPVGRKIGFV